MSVIDDSIPLRKLDDLSLMRKFFAGENTLLSNQNLRAESAFNEVQLLARREGVVATLKLEKTATAMIREQSSYRLLLHEALEDNGFVLMSMADSQGFIQYQKYTVPDGYRVNCTEARYLWREWWMLYKSSPRAQSPLQMNLLVLVRDQWYPIREMVSSQGMLYIKTLVKEIVMDGSGQIAWLNRRKEAQVPSADPLPGVDAGVHGEVTQIEPPEFSTPTSPRRIHPALASRQVPRRSSSISRTSALEQASAPKKETGSRSASHPPSPMSSNMSSTVESPTYETWADTRGGQQDVAPMRKPVSTPEPSNIPVQLAAQPMQQEFPDVSAVLKFREGRIYVTTVIGELVIEGGDLKFWLNQAS